MSTARYCFRAVCLHFAVVCRQYHATRLRAGRLGSLTLGSAVSAVQLGFIMGTLAFGLLRLADRVSPARLFLLCVVAGSLTNAALLLPGAMGYAVVRACA